MKNTNIESRIKSVNSLQISSFAVEKANNNLLLVNPNAKLLKSADDLGKYDKFIVGGEIIYVNPAASSRQKQDLLNSKLLAQLHANNAAGSAENTQVWYKSYVEVLENIGFAINNFGFSKIHQQDTSIQVDKAFVELLLALATDDEVDGLKAALEAVQALEDKDGKITLFSASANASSGGKFQISTGTINENGNLEAVLGAYYTEKHDTRGNFLWFTWGELTFDVWFSGQKIELDEEIYSGLRQAIITKLGDKATKYIQGLDI